MAVRAFLIVAAVAASADAQRHARSDPGACLDAAASSLAVEGASRLGAPIRVFLHEGRSHAVPVRFEHDGCIGMLAVGHTQVVDLDLALYTRGGIALVEDEETARHPYARYCGAAGLELVAVLNMTRGRGEVLLQMFTDAPNALPDLNRSIGECFASAGGVPPPDVEIGAEPPGAALDTTLERATAHLTSIGYEAQGVDERGELPLRTRRVHPLSLAAGRCYAVIVAGDRAVRDLDLYLRSGDGLELARDVRRTADAAAKLCVSDPRPILAEVRMVAGEGAYALRVLSLVEPPGRRSPGIEGAARFANAEARTMLGRQGLRVREHAWGFVAPSATLAMPVPVAAGRCYGFAAVPSSDLRGGDLDLLVLDEANGRVGWDLGRREPPVVYHCAERDAVLRVIGRIYGARGRYLLLVGEDAESRSPPEQSLEESS
jgi:hypothetical protein